MVVFPKAKINIGLLITAKRDDGYHNIETIFYPVGLCDALEFVISADSGGNDILTLSGIPVDIRPEDNIIMRVIGRLREIRSFPPLRMHLHKAIPHGAGLGGGSSDAACLLKSLNRYFGLSLNEDKMKSIALEIGSDCPFFIAGEPAFATGRGELIEPIDPIIEGHYLLLLNPGVIINTSEAYRNCKPGIPSSSLLPLVKREITEWKDLIINDFEKYAFTRHPVIKKIKDDLYDHGALFSSMSGSGSTIYGIFKNKPSPIPPSLNNLIIWQGTI